MLRRSGELRKAQLIQYYFFMCVQQFHVEYTIVCFMMLCKIHSLILGNWGIDSYATSGLVGFKRVWEIIQKSMVVYLILNITVLQCRYYV